MFLANRDQCVIYPHNSPPHSFNVVRKIKIFWQLKCSTTYQVSIPHCYQYFILLYIIFADLLDMDFSTLWTFWQSTV